MVVDIGCRARVPAEIIEMKDTWLKKIRATMAPVVRQYAGNRLVAETALPESAEVAADGAVWRCKVHTSPSPDHPGVIDMKALFTVVSGSADAAGVGLAFDFAGWSPDNYLLLPAAVYKGNDFAVSSLKYPPLWRDPAQFRPDMPVTTTPVPRLAADSPRLEQTTGDVAVPCMGFHSPGLQLGFLLLTTQGSRLGNHGLTVETNAERTACRFLVTAPAVREFRQDHCKALPSDDRGVAWKSGDTLVLRFQVAVFAAPALQALFDRFCELRKGGLNPAVRHESLPFSAAWRLVEEKSNQDNWVEDLGYYKMAPNAHTTFEVQENPLCFLWQLGWVGGGMLTLPLLGLGSETTRARAMRNLEMIFAKTQAPSGFFYGIGDGEKFYSDGFDRPHPHHLHMVRKSGDWLYFAIRHFDLLEKQKRPVPAAWAAAIRKLADAFVRLWEASGQFGQFVDVETGALLVGGSASGAIVPGALTLASQYFNDPRYLQVAEAAARQYEQEFVRAGITTGGPGEILSAPDSESAFALVESFVALLEATGDDCWARAAHDLIRQAATWVVAYDYVFPAESPLGQAGAHSTGAVFANIQNKHGAPGICTWSGDSLFRYWRRTGDAFALDLIRDIAHGIPQYLARADQPLSDAMKPGWMCERVNLSDWEGAKGVGGQLFGSASWTETALALTIFDLPGLYVQPDTGFFCAFDNISVERVSSPAGKMALKLANPTAFDAQVKVLNESAAARQKPLGLNPLLRSSTLRVPAGKTLVVMFG
jgi:hypothetical protein